MVSFLQPHPYAPAEVHWHPRMKTFLSSYVQSFHYPHPVTKLPPLAITHSCCWVSLLTGNACHPRKENQKMAKSGYCFGKRHKACCCHTPSGKLSGLSSSTPWLIVLFSSLFQNLKVSSQTNFLSRAWWFPIFYFFEKNVQGSIPCCFSWPLSWPPGCFKSSCKKYSRVQKMGEDNEKSTWVKQSIGSETKRISTVTKGIVF